MYFGRKKNPSFYNVRRPCLYLNTTDQKQHLIPEFLTKSFDNKLQSCVDVANEYLQVYSTSADVKTYLFCNLCQYKSAGYTMLLFAFVLSLG